MKQQRVSDVVDAKRSLEAIDCRLHSTGELQAGVQHEGPNGRMLRRREVLGVGADVGQVAQVQRRVDDVGLA